MPVARGKTVSTDKFPNFLTGSVTESAADTFTTAQVFTPIPRLKTAGNKATVMELLWVDFMNNNQLLNASGEQWRFQMSIGSVPTALLAFNDPRTIMEWKREMEILTTGGTVADAPIKYDFQSADGYGFLLASDAFNVSVAGTATGVAAIIQWRLYYRFVDIPLAEFVGLVQSTQQS